MSSVAPSSYGFALSWPAGCESRQTSFISGHMLPPTTQRLPWKTYGVTSCRGENIESDLYSCQLLPSAVYQASAKLTLLRLLKPPRIQSFPAYALATNHIRSAHGACANARVQFAPSEEHQTSLWVVYFG